MLIGCLPWQDFGRSCLPPRSILRPSVMDRFLRLRRNEQRLCCLHQLAVCERRYVFAGCRFNSEIGKENRLLSRRGRAGVWNWVVGEKVSFPCTELQVVISSLNLLLSLPWARPLDDEVHFVRPGKITSQRLSAGPEITTVGMDSSKKRYERGELYCST